MLKSSTISTRYNNSTVPRHARQNVQSSRTRPRSAGLRKTEAKPHALCHPHTPALQYNRHAGQACGIDWSFLSVLAVRPCVNSLRRFGSNFDRGTPGVLKTIYRESLQKHIISRQMLISQGSKNPGQLSSASLDQPIRHSPLYIDRGHLYVSASAETVWLFHNRVEKRPGLA